MGVRSKKIKKFPELYMLKGYLRKRNVPQRSLADMLGTTLNTLSSKLCGYTCFTIDEVIKMAKVLNVPTEKIVKLIETDYINEEEVE